MGRLMILTPHCFGKHLPLVDAFLFGDRIILVLMNTDDTDDKDGHRKYPCKPIRSVSSLF